MNVYEKLLNVRNELRNTKLTMSGFNKFAKYNYFELKDFLPTIEKLCIKHKLFTHFSLNEDYAVLTIVDIEKPSEKIEFKTTVTDAVMKGANPIQEKGSTITYMRRYTHLIAFDILESDGIDGLNQKENQVILATQTQVNQLKELLNTKSYTLQNVIDYVAPYDIQAPETFDYETMKKTINKLKKSPNKEV